MTSSDSSSWFNARSAPPDAPKGATVCKLLIVKAMRCVIGKSSAGDYRSVTESPAVRRAPPNAWTMPGPTSTDPAHLIGSGSVESMLLVMTYQALLDRQLLALHFREGIGAHW